jgi:hypothetical protein
VNRIFEAALEVDQFCRAKAWSFCIIGGVAVQRWGEPRGTQDVDLTVIAGFGGEEAFVDALLAAFSPRRADARDFALRSRVLLARATNGTPLDVALGGLPYEERAAKRSTDFEVAPGQTIRTCGAEDLVILKAFAGRERDWIDLERVAVRQAGRLDERLIFRELEPLLELKGAPEAAARLREILRKAQ